MKIGGSPMHRSGAGSQDAGEIRHQRIYRIEMTVALDPVANDVAAVDIVLGHPLDLQQILDRLPAGAREKTSMGAPV